MYRKCNIGVDPTPTLYTPYQATRGNYYRRNIYSYKLDTDVVSALQIPNLFRLFIMVLCHKPCTIQNNVLLGVERLELFIEHILYIYKSIPSLRVWLGK